MTNGFTVNHNHLFPFDLNKFDRHFVGFDQMFERLNKFNEQMSSVKLPNYPPYNIKKTGENTYVIELAVAGFGKNDIELVLDDGKLTVTGRINVDSDDTMIYQGISSREFSRQFSLADTIEVKNADLINGMLKVWLENIIPEHKKPKKIEIGEGGEEPTSEKQLLAE